MKKITLASLIAALLAGTVGGVGYKVIRDNQADIFEDSIHKVERVVDGDTIDIEGGERIRLLGIDTPESGACFSAESTSYLQLLLADAHITIEKDITGSDRYERLLRYVYIPSDDIKNDDVFVNEQLVREGYAVVMPVAPDNRYRDLLSSAQAEAKDTSRGMWAACDMSAHSSNLREVDTPPADPSCNIKGNISEKAYGRNYFVPGCPNYNRIKIDQRKGEAYFCNEEEAVAAGFTRSASCDNSF